MARSRPLPRGARAPGVPVPPRARTALAPARASARVHPRSAGRPRRQRQGRTRVGRRRTGLGEAWRRRHVPWPRSARRLPVSRARNGGGMAAPPTTCASSAAADRRARRPRAPVASRLPLPLRVDRVGTDDRSRAIGGAFPGPPMPASPSTSTPTCRTRPLVPAHRLRRHLSVRRGTTSPCARSSTPSHAARRALGSALGQAGPATSRPGCRCASTTAAAARGSAGASTTAAAAAVAVADDWGACWRGRRGGRPSRTFRVHHPAEGPARYRSTTGTDTAPHPAGGPTRPADRAPTGRLSGGVPTAGISTRKPECLRSARVGRNTATSPPHRRSTSDGVRGAGCQHLRVLGRRTPRS